MEKHIDRLDIDPALNEIEDVNNAIFFIACALPEYPNAGGMVELGTILDCLSKKAEAAIKKIKEVADL